jgi:3-deoxy-D-manno-octulosonic-acid transferase
MIYWVYNFFLTCVFLLALPFLPLFIFLGERYRKGLLQRMAFYPKEFLASARGTRPIWIHAVSVGEVLAARHLARELKQRFPSRKIVFSTFTSTGNEMARKTVSAADLFTFLPLDHPWIVRRALAQLDPSVLIFLETEIWPNLLRSTYRKGIPTLLLSGRLSPNAFRRYSLFRLFFSNVVRQFTAVGMQSSEDAERMACLGVDPDKIRTTGNLKHTPLEREEGSLQRTGDKILATLGPEGRPVLVMGSTHAGEEEILLDVFLFLKSRFPTLLMVLAPRHPHRFDEVEQLLRSKSVRYEKKSEMNGRVAEISDVIFLDTLGDLPVFYALAHIAFVGGSLVDAGGHNLVEPARFRKPILFGPYMTNCADLADEMKRRGAGIEVSSREDLIGAISELLADQTKAGQMGELAYNVVQGDQGVMKRSMELVSRYLQP